MSEVFLCAKDQLTSTSRRDLRKAGVVVVEVDDPSSCQFIRSSEVINTDDMVWALLDALNHEGKIGYCKGEAQRERLAQNLLKIVLDSRQPKPAQP